MPFAVNTTDDFDGWFDGLEAGEQARVLVAVGVLAEAGPALGRPRVDTVNGSDFPNMKELRVQLAGRPLRILFAFDPTRTALLLVGGDKTADNRFYDRMIRQADDLYGAYLKALENR